MTNHQAIFALNPLVKVIRGDVAYDADGNEVAYDKAVAQAYVDAHAYQTNRAAEYPSFAEQFDTLYHGGYDAWKATIDSVKAKYPKP
jgi:rhodanese-related sulfurtransferase